MGRVGRGGDRCARSLDLLLPLQLHHLVADLELGDGAVARTDEKVTVSQERHAVDAELEEGVTRTNSLEEPAIEADLDDVTSEGAHESTSVVRGDCDTLESSLDLTHLQVSKENLLLLVVNIPYTKAVVVDCHKLLVGVIIECNLVRNIHTNSVSTDCFSTSNLI